MKPSYKELLPNVTTFVFDVDGVLTNGTLFLLADDMVRKMNTRDGLALKMAVDRGYRVLIITGGASPAVKDRLFRLGISDIYIGVRRKTEVLDAYIAEHQLQASEMLYMGDDLPDYHAMSKCGVKTCPADAVAEIKGIADYVSGKQGGRGCVRDVIEQTLKVQGKWFDPEKEIG